VGGIISPVVEEIFFRGILFGFFRRWGATTAVVLSTILFVLPHLKRGAIPVTQMVGGVVFAAAYEKEKSLAAPIIIHSLGNLSIFSLSLIPQMVQ
jgi:membrane protease YdiL (CAAX protease family)